MKKTECWSKAAYVFLYLCIYLYYDLFFVFFFYYIIIDPIPHELISEKTSSPNISLDDLVLSETISTKEDENCNNLDTEYSVENSVENFSENNPVEYSNQSDKLNNHSLFPSPDIEMKSNSDQELQDYFSDQNSGYVHLETSTGTVLFEAEKTTNKDVLNKETCERLINHDNHCSSSDMRSIELSESSEVGEGNNNEFVEDKIEIFKVCEKQDSSNVSGGISLKYDQCNQDGLALDTPSDTERYEQKQEPKTASANDVPFHEQIHCDIVKSTGVLDECHSQRDLTAVIPTESNKFHQEEHHHVSTTTITAVGCHMEKPDTSVTSTENNKLLVEGHVSDGSYVRAINSTPCVLSVDADFVSDNNCDQASILQKSTNPTLNNQVDGPWPWGTIPQYKKSKKVIEYSELCKNFKSFQIDDYEPKCESIESLMPTTAPLCLESIPNITSKLNKFYRQSSAKLLNEIYDNQAISSSKHESQNNVNKDSTSEPRMLLSDGEETSAVVLPPNTVANVQCTEENLSKDDYSIDDANTLVNKGNRRFSLDFEKTNTSAKFQVSLKKNEVSSEFTPNESVSKVKTENHKKVGNTGSLGSQLIDVPQKSVTRSKYVPVKNKTNNLKFGSFHVQPDQLKEDLSLSEDSDSSTTSYSEEDDFSESFSSEEYSFSDSLSSISSDASKPCHRTSAGHNPSFPWHSLTDYPSFYPSYPYHYTWANWMPQVCQAFSQRQSVSHVPTPFHTPCITPPASLTQQQLAHSYFQQYNYIQWMVKNSVL